MSISIKVLRHIDSEFAAKNNLCISCLGTVSNREDCATGYTSCIFDSVLINDVLDSSVDLLELIKYTAHAANVELLSENATKMLFMDDS